MRFRLQLTILALIFVAISASCGKRRPPLPPVERVPQRVEIDGRQVGDLVTLVWKMPARNAPAGSSLRISRIDVYRLAEQLSEPLSLTEQDFADRSTLIGSIDIDDTDFGFKEMSFPDKLQIVGQSVRLRYAVRLRNAAGQKAAFSNFFLIEPVANIATAPTDLKVDVAQTAVSLDWTAPSDNLDKSAPANVLGYNVYRSEDGAATQKLNEDPVTESLFADSAFKFGATYRYFVRSVSLGRNAEEVESFSSETVTVSPVDTFAPAPPEAITIASAPSVISIFFAFNIEPDVAGYRVYRATDRTLPKNRWQLLSDEILTANSFQDKTVVPGVVYYYYITAIDNAGNVSGPSEVVSDSAL